MDLVKAKGKKIKIPPKAPAWLEKQFMLLGWGSSIPGDAEAKKIYFEQFYEYLAYNNPYHPYEMPYNFVLPAYFKALVEGRVEDVYPNVASLMKGFRTWIDSNRKSLRQAWAAKDGGYYENPGAIHDKYIKP